MTVLEQVPVLRGVARADIHSIRGGRRHPFPVPCDFRRVVSHGKGNAASIARVAKREEGVFRLGDQRGELGGQLVAPGIG